MGFDWFRLRARLGGSVASWLTGGAALLLNVANPGCSSTVTPTPSPDAAYGPQGCWRDEQCVSQHGLGWVCNRSLTPAGCRPEDVVAYGPVGCWRDDECVSEQGAGWYCDTASAPAQCRMRSYPDAAYGPPPCTDDERCESMYGAGWYCDREHGWPTCRVREDAGPGDVVDGGDDPVDATADGPPEDAAAR